MRDAKPSSEKAPKIIPLRMRRDAGTKTRSKINVRVIIALDLEDRISQFLIAIAYWTLISILRSTITCLAISDQTNDESTEGPMLPTS